MTLDVSSPDSNLTQLLSLSGCPQYPGLLGFWVFGFCFDHQFGLSVYGMISSGYWPPGSPCDAGLWILC